MVGTLASVALTKIHEEVERHWRWLILLIAMILVGSLVGLFVGTISGVLIGLALGLLGIPVGRRTETRIREIEHRGQQ